jgi:hypothetical protein
VVLHEMHGERARVSHLLLVYGAGAACAALFLVGVWLLGLAWWKLILISEAG